MIEIKLANVYKNYGSKEILHSINAEFPKGDVTVILGASGAGKTTIARLIAGLEKVNAGEIFFNGDLVSAKRTHVEPQKRKVAYLFQDLALLPHMNVQKNLETVLKAQKVESAERNKLISQKLSEFSLTGKEKRSIDELSGGEKQRVAIVRALLQNPQILILDEPFSAIDTELRDEISTVISQTIEKYKLTTLIITHNHEEALQFADNLLILEDGKIIDSGKPADIYKSPKSEKSAKIFKQPARKWKNGL